jgi:uncharacterized protein (DUF4415 family)
MIVSEPNTGSTWIDPDDAPELTDEWFEKATFRIGNTVIRRGRPAGSSKTQVSLRLDNEVIEAFRAQGPGWQSRMNEALRKAAGV